MPDMIAALSSSRTLCLVDYAGHLLCCLECRQAAELTSCVFVSIPQGPGNIPTVGPFQTLLQLSHG